MPPRPDVSEERSEQILQAATQVFSQKGFSKARMDDIASQAGLSKGALYLYFKSKDAIITALLERIFQREMRDLRALQHAQGSARERLLRFADALLEDLPTWLNLIPVAYEFLGLIFRNKTVQKAFRQYLRAYVKLAVPIIEEGIANGEFQPRNPVEVALAMGAIFEGTILLWVYDSEMVDIRQQMRSSMEILLTGIVRPEA